MAKTRRSYKGGAISTTTTSSIASSGTTTFTISTYTGWPYGSAPFYVVVEPGTSNEEKILVTRAGATDTTLSVYSLPSVSSNRGLDGTNAFAHNAGSTIYTVFTALDADEANELASTLTSQGDILIHGASTFGRVGIGTAGQVLKVNSGATAPEWGQVATAGIATDAITAAQIAANAVGASELADNAVDTAAIVNLAVTTAKINDLNVTTGKLADNAVTTAKITDANVTLAKLATAVQNLLVPAGVIVATLKSTADTGWIALNGTPVAGASGTYPSLYAATSGISGWWSGSTFTPPNMTNKMLEGVGTTAVGQEGGSNTTTIAAANLPAHFHDINHDHASENFSSSHSHTPASPYEKFVVQDQLTGDQFGVVTSSQPGGLAANNIDNTASATVTIAVNLSALGATSSTGTYTTTDRGTAVANTAMTTTNAHIAVYFQIKAH